MIFYFSLKVPFLRVQLQLGLDGCISVWDYTVGLLYALETIMRSNV